MNESPSPVTITAFLRPKRRWFQWRLRTLLIGLTVVCVALGALVDRAARERRATEWLAERGFRVFVASRAPEWMPAWLEREFFTYTFMVDNTEVGSSGHRGERNDHGRVESSWAPANIELFFLLCPWQGWRPPPIVTDLADGTGECLRAIRGCQALSLRQARIGDDGLRGLGKLSRLEYLDLSESTLRDDDLRHLAGLKKLRILNLRGTGVTDAGLAHLTALTGLQKLTLDDTAVSDAAIARLRKLRGLDHISLRQTRVSDLARDALAQALPDCGIDDREAINGL